jgi:hypothetical protein
MSEHADERNHSRAERKMLALLALHVDRHRIERFVMDVYNSWAGSSTRVDHAQAIEYLASPLENATFHGVNSSADVFLMEEILSSGVPWDDEDMAETEREYGQHMLLYVSLLILHLFREDRTRGIDALLAYPVVFTQVMRYASAIGDTELHVAVGEYLRTITPLWHDAEMRTLTRLGACGLDAMRIAQELAACIEAIAASPRLDDSSSFWNSRPLASARSLCVDDLRQIAAALRHSGELAAGFAVRIDPKHQRPQ